MSMLSGYDNLFKKKSMYKFRILFYFLILTGDTLVYTLLAPDTNSDTFFVTRSSINYNNIK